MEVMDITELLAFAVKSHASDLHLCSGLPPMIRVHGEIRRLQRPALEHKDDQARSSAVYGSAGMSREEADGVVKSLMTANLDKFQAVPPAD